MAGRPPAAAGTPTSLRVQVLRELQAMIDEREVRDRVDRGPLAETKGREHWVLHLLLRSDELSQGHLSTLVGSAYANLSTRLGQLEERLARVEAAGETRAGEVQSRLDTLTAAVGEKVATELGAGVDRAAERLEGRVLGNLETRWKPVGESIETFARASHQLTKDVSDTYRAATQTRLLLNENARRMIDLGRDLVALEESLKLALSKTIEEGLQPLEERIAALESRLGATEVAGDSRTTAEPRGTD